MPPLTLAEWLIQRYPTAKRTTLRRMVEAGRISVNGAAAIRFNQPLQPTDQVAERVEPAAGKSAAGKTNLKIVYEDADVLVVDKPPGLLTSTTPRETRLTLLAQVQAYFSDAAAHSVRVGLIHRLDRDAAGLLVFSKTDLAYKALKTQFFHHDVARVYHALVIGRPRMESGRIETYLVERADGSVYSTRQAGKGELAVTHFETVTSGNKRTLLRVTLETGRKHQIRVHLSEMGCPIVGDPMYGPQSEEQPSAGARPRLMLVATHLAFQHPRTAEPLKFDLGIPRALRAG